MLIPVRCFTCGAVVSEKYDAYEEKVRSGTDPAKALDELGITRYCCRRMFISHVNAMDQIIEYGRF